MGESERSSLPLLIDAGEPIEWLRARVRRAHYNERIAYAHALEAESRERVAIARADQAEALLLEFVRACPDDNARHDARARTDPDGARARRFEVNPARTTRATNRRL